ncbi:uncharacterized protein K02A2.6-like [Diachasma alloeum]|uniref:uncharacterized protein K02A2.6-like n=1 Tax=Diachasma alloeum TaxID=454923 RepID=UPI0007382C61|nr:uncharacterized protein K02A2.6-like [Diachasma alloeum]
MLIKKELIIFLDITATKGITTVTVQYKHTTRRLPLIITSEEKGPNLFGENWFKPFDIVVTGIQTAQLTPETDYITILDKFPALTAPTLSGHAGKPINIQIKPDCNSKFFKARKIPFGITEMVSEALEDMVKQGMITPTDQSDWATPVLFVPKNLEKKLRVVGDYKVAVNPVITDAEYPLPTVKEVMTTLNGGKKFSQIDLKNAYKQIRVDSETSKILTISTPKRLFNVNVLLDGLNIARRIFKKFIETHLTDTEHDERLIQVLKRLESANLIINKEKCIFGVKEMEFLGYLVSDIGVKPLKGKVKAISNIPTLSNVKELQVFLGGLNFYADFIKDRATDHKPLCSIFNPHKPTPEIISPKLSRYSATLSAYRYELLHRPGNKHSNADLLSRLPLEEELQDEEQSYQEVFMIENVSRNPITPEDIAKSTSTDQILTQLKNGWWTDGLFGHPYQKKVPEIYKHYWSKRQEMSLHKGCILWGNRVVMPEELRDTILQYLHANHPGICSTKAAARSYTWWPGQTFLIVVDATTKWLEVKRMPSPNSQMVIKALRDLFATFDLPHTIVSDNGTAFSSSEIKEFYKKNGIKSIYIAPYNPESNGQAERMVHTAKRSLNKLSYGNSEVKLPRLLLKQHVTPSSTTGKSPAEEMFGRPLRTALDVLKPSDERPHDDQTLKIRELPIGVRLQMKNYRASGPKWVIALFKMYSKFNELGGREER